MKIIDENFHAVLDYVVVAFLLISPSLFQFTEAVSTFTYVLGGIHLVLTLTTNFKGGVLKVIPLKAHGMIELVLSIILIIVPWLLSFTNQTDRYFYSAFGLVVFLTWLLTDYTHKRTLPKESVV